MDRAAQYALTGGALVMGALLVYGGYGLTQHVIVAVDHWGDTGLQATALVRRLNGKNGTVDEIDKLVLALKSTTVHADMAVAHEDKQLSTIDRYAARMVGDVDRVSNSLAATADAGTETARSASRAIDTANDSIASVRPVVSHLDATVSGFNDQLPYFHRIIESGATTSEQVAASSVSVNKMLATAEKKVDAKPTIKGRILEYGGPIIKLLAWFAK